jgi:hypothetical protein
MQTRLAKIKSSSNNDHNEDGKAGR